MATANKLTVKVTTMLDKFPVRERYALVMGPNGQEATRFDNLKKGDTFYLCEPDGELVDHKGAALWTALADPVDGSIQVTGEG